MLDTHIAIWMTISPDVLTRRERACLELARGALVLSAVSVWELSLKWNRLRVTGERKGPLNPAEIVLFAEASGWEFLPLTMLHATSALREALNQADPFDEMLLRQAQEEGLRLLTRDAKLVDHGLSATRTMLRE